MNAILAAMLNGALLGALVATAVWVGLRVAPQRALNAATRCLVWWAVLMAVVLLPVAFLRMPSQASTLRVFLRAPTKTAVEPIPQVPPSAGTPDSNMPAPSSGFSFPLVISAGPAARWTLAAWAVIAAMMLVRLAVSCILLERRKRRAYAAPPHLAAHVEGWLSRRGSARHVRLACSAEITTPMLAGLRRPAILIPERLMRELQEAELEQIGLHEAAHVARRDDYVLLLQRAIEAMFALHPIVRWITRQIDLEREIACDDIVVETTGHPRSYADCLTRIVELCGGVHASWAGAPAAGDRSHLAKRVDSLLERNRSTVTRPAKARLAASLAMVAALAFFAGRTPGVIAFATPPAPVEAFEPAVNVPQPEPAEEPQTPQTPPAPLPPQTVAATVSQPAVMVRVTVQDPLNRYVTGLGKENFRLFEDGQEQEISEFSTGHAPISAGIVLDTSGSMGAKLEAPRLAVEQFLGAANPQDEFFLVTFNDEAELAAGFTSDAGQIQSPLNLVHARGGTALRDAIHRALAEMKNARNPDKVLLVISDGNDNSSSLSQADLRTEVRAANVQIYAITFGEPGGSGIRARAMLGELVGQSGGQQFVVDDLSKAPGAAAGVAVRNLYVLGYQSKNAARDGKFRNLRVEAVPPQGLPPLKVSFREGYYAPAP